MAEARSCKPELGFSQYSTVEIKPVSGQAQLSPGAELGTSRGKADTELLCGSTPQPKSKQLRLSWALALGTLTLSILSVIYAWSVLVSNGPALSRLRSLSPGKTVWVISILSQSVAFLVSELLSMVFEALRWVLVSRDSGVLLSTFLALSRATPLLGVASLCSTHGSHRFWCSQRLVFLSLTWLLGVVLIYNVKFKHVYATNGVYKFNVTAGLAPPNSSLVDYVPRLMIGLHFLAFTHTILTDSTFAVGVPPLACRGNDCSSFFLPGGLRQVRLQNRDFNSSLFNTQQPDGPTSVLIHNAPGYQLEFSPVEANHTFNSETDCTIYGKATGVGIFLCLASSETKILAGWSVCPSTLDDHGSCFNDTTWAGKLDQSTSLSLFKRYATVAYDRNNFSIRSIESISPPSAEVLVAQDFTKVYKAVFAPIPEQLNPSASDFKGFAAIYSLQVGIGWTLRLYQDYFPESREAPLSLLQGFLTVPIQFSTTAWQIVDTHDLPSDLNTVASMTGSTYRAIGEPWTIFTFGGLAIFLIIWALAFLAWIQWASARAPDTTLFPEIDIALMCGDLTQFLRRRRIGGTSEAVKKGLKGEKISCVEDKEEWSIVLGTESLG
ncbi:MAG: hypothetical protein M1839_006958 [Geoglossum umbratile]|nr:MAG: hypothetical protein M1839_006958 [Geoglossum umbratile]